MACADGAIQVNETERPLEDDSQSWPCSGHAFTTGAATGLI